MKKILLLSSLAIAGILIMGTGCNRLPISQSNTNEPAPTVTHIVMREVNPDDLTADSTGDTFNVYLGETASRAEIAETIQVGDLPADATTMYFFSDLTEQQNYMFTYPNEITEADRSTMPVDHPLNQGEDIIVSMPTDQLPSGSANISFIELLLQPVLNIPQDQFKPDATAPYVITDDYVDEFDDNSPLERRTTIDPKTNLPTQVQLLDKTTGDSIGTIAIDEYVIDDQSQYATDFFSIEGWKKSLPGKDHVIVEEDITQ